MELIDQHWLATRGDLHDATLTAFQQCGTNVEIEISDEWVNERGLTLPEGMREPGRIILRIILESATLSEGVPRQAVGGWISYVEYQAGQFLFQFCDRDPLAFKVVAARWRSGEQSRPQQ